MLLSLPELNPAVITPVPTAAFVTILPGALLYWAFLYASTWASLGSGWGEASEMPKGRHFRGSSLQHHAKALGGPPPLPW